jgi:hypothetical protein
MFSYFSISGSFSAQYTPLSMLDGPGISTGPTSIDYNQTAKLQEKPIKIVTTINISIICVNNVLQKWRESILIT